MFMHMCMSSEAVAKKTAKPQRLYIFNLTTLSGSALFSEVATPIDSHDIVTFSPIDKFILIIFCSGFCIYVKSELGNSPFLNNH